MLRTLKKVILSSLSILGISFLTYIVFLLNPTLSYSNSTQIDNVTIYHNETLELETSSVIKDAVSIISKSDIYNKNIEIQLCLNDDKYYPDLYPFAGATAYAFFNKTVIYDSTPSFKHNYAEFKYEANNFESRKYNLTTLLAHEFMHNMQSHFDTKYYITSTLGKLNWKLEGHAEYIAREFKNDGLLKEKIAIFQIQENKEHIGTPVFILEDGTIQNLYYYKRALAIQFLMEIKGLDFGEICRSDNIKLENVYTEMLAWNKIETQKN